MFRTKLLFFLFLIILFKPLYSQNRLPPVYNFNAKDYSAGNQNWDILKADNYVFAANNEGLLEFDGKEWRLYALPNKTIVRSVGIDSNRIYTGSYEEFGYWERNPNGVLIYYSLSGGLSQETIETQTIWGIYPFDNKVIFKSFSTIFIYEEGKIKVLETDKTLLGANVINNEFYVFAAEQGFYKLVEKELEFLPESAPLKGFNVQSFVPYRNGEILIGTALNGCFTYKNKQLVPWDHSLNEVLKENQLNRISTSPDGKMLFGTIKNGLYVYDPSIKRTYNFFMKNGLQNNTVLGCIYNDGEVWLALDYGISAIPVEGYAFYLNPEKEDIGAVYDVVTLDENIYAATNTGIYKINDEGITFLEGSEDHTWDLHVVGNEIICGHNLGTYIIKEDQLFEIGDRNGGYVFKKIPELANSYIQGNYKGLTMYVIQGSGWQVNNIKNIDFPVKQIVFESQREAWVAHPYKGVYKITFSEDYKTVTATDYKYNRQFDNIYDIRLYNIEGNIAFYHMDTWYKYNSIEDTIVPFRSLMKLLGNNASARLISDSGTSPYVFKRKDGAIFIRKTLQDSLTQEYLPPRYYEGKLISYDEKAISIRDSVLAIGLYNDILTLNTDDIVVEKEAIPIISRVYKNSIPVELTNQVVLGKRDTLRMHASIPFLSNTSLLYKINSNNFWKETDGVISLTGLDYGNGILKIKTANTSDESENVLEVPFYVSYPWYMGIWGVVLLMVLATLGIYIITVINKYVLIKHKKYLDEQYEHQKELHRKEEAIYHEKKINEMMKERHQQDLNVKTKELANTAMEMTKKNELLQTLKTELLKFKKEIINKEGYDKLIKNIDKHIGNNKDWEVFESNFNEIHDSFFKRLLELHPDNLTPKDLKLCAYLKMNLSTKEIAPLMGISIRGVEIHRYRLRKRLRLETEQNLNEYLMSIS